MLSNMDLLVDCRTHLSTGKIMRCSENSDATPKGHIQWADTEVAAKVNHSLAIPEELRRKAANL